MPGDYPADETREQERSQCDMIGCYAEPGQQACERAQEILKPRFQLVDACHCDLTIARCGTQPSMSCHKAKPIHACAKPLLTG